MAGPPGVRVPPRRLNRRAATAACLAEQHPAHFVAFDLLQHGTDLTARPYTEHRAALEALLVDHRLGPPWTLCPTTTDLSTARKWLSWSVVGIEGGDEAALACWYARISDPAEWL